MVPAQQVKQAMDCQQRQLCLLVVSVLLRLPAHSGPRDGDVAEVIAFPPEREHVGRLVFRRERSIQAPHLFVVGDPDGHRRGAFREARRHLGHVRRPAQDLPHEPGRHRPGLGLHDFDFHYIPSVKILVTGGAGFIGSHVVDAYVAAGHEVAVLDNLATGLIENVNPAAQLHRVDVRDLAHVQQTVGSFKPDVVSHHAAQAEVPKSVADPGTDAHINVVGGLNVLRACIDNSVRKVIFSSTGGALYGEPDVVPNDEDHPIRPLSPYGTSKFAFEQYMATFERTFGITFTTLRYANVYGPRQDFFAEEGRVVAIFANRMLQNRQLTIDGDGNQSRDMLHVGDVATANIAALEKGDGGTFHISTGIPVTVNDIFRKLAILTEYKLEPMHGPARKGDVYRIALDNTRAREQLGWQPRIQLEEGLRTTVDYFREYLARVKV